MAKMQYKCATDTVCTLCFMLCDQHRWTCAGCESNRVAYHVSSLEKVMFAEKATIRAAVGKLCLLLKFEVPLAVRKAQNSSVGCSLLCVLDGVVCVGCW